MKIENNKISGDIVIEVNSQFNHLDADRVTVESDVVTRLYGTINKSIHIKKGAIVYLHGRFSGEVKNDGGILYVFDPTGGVVTY